MNPPPLNLNAKSPWPGPSAYTERDAAFFFGRSAETTEMLRLVRAEPVSVLFGLSGLGKTSLLQAGLFPRLRDEGWLPVRLRLNYAADAPPLTEQALTKIARAARALSVITPTWDAANDTLADAFHQHGERFWGASEDQPVVPVLVLDQFEECWTTTRTNPTARAKAETFITELANLVQSDAARDATARIVFAIREDQLAPLESLRPLFPGLRTARLRLLPFTREQALQVVTRPGTPLLASNAAEAIVDAFAATDPLETTADPALLSIYCWRLNEDRQARNAEQITAERAVAMRGQFIHEFYESALNALPVSQAQAARRFIETDLIDAVGFRTSAGYQHAEKQHDVQSTTLEHLINQRLLHPVDRSVGQRHVELVHDRLAEEASTQRSDRKSRERQDQLATEHRELQIKLSHARRRIVVLGLLAMLACIGGTGAFIMWRRALSAEAEMKISRDVSQAARDVALRRSEDAKAALAQLDQEKVKTDIALDNALGARTEADEIIQFLQFDLTNTPGIAPDVLRRINDRVTAYRDLFPPEPDDVNTSNSRLLALVQRAGLQIERGELSAARETLNRVIAIGTQALEASPDNERAREVINTARNILRQPKLKVP